MAGSPAYKRVLLKISGEVLAGAEGFGIDPNQLRFVSNEIKSAFDLGVQIGIVIGGGNIYRGLSGANVGISRATGDYMGMLATVINSLALQSNLERIGVHTRVLTALRIDAVAEPYIRRRAIRHMEKGRAVIMASGTGNPYFTTDTAAALRGVETKVDVILKGTKVDGVYDSDPMVNSSAVKFDTITYDKAINHDLRVMDQTAFTLCRENDMSVIVFKLTDQGNLRKVVIGDKIGTTISV